MVADRQLTQVNLPRCHRAPVPSAHGVIFPRRWMCCRSTDNGGDGSQVVGGWGGIRTHETLAGPPVFKTGAFNRSATHPLSEIRYLHRLQKATRRIAKRLHCSTIDWKRALQATRGRIREACTRRRCAQSSRRRVKMVRAWLFRRALLHDAWLWRRGSPCFDHGNRARCSIRRYVGPSPPILSD